MNPKILGALGVAALLATGALYLMGTVSVSQPGSGKTAEGVGSIPIYIPLPTQIADGGTSGDGGCAPCTPGARYRVKSMSPTLGGTAVEGCFWDNIAHPGTPGTWPLPACIDVEPGGPEEFTCPVAPSDGGVVCWSGQASGTTAGLLQANQITPGVR